MNYRVTELKLLCKGLGIKGYSKLRKKELIKVLDDFENPNREEYIEPEKEKDIEKDIEKNTGEEECTICLCDKKDEYALKCNHSFCKMCIESWKENSMSCPICRRKIVETVKIINLDDYLSEEDFINYIRRLNMN